MLEALCPVPLTDTYALYQSLMEYRADVMQDDFYQISADGWKAKPTWETKGRKKVWHCDLLPKDYIVNRYFPQEEAERLNLMPRWNPQNRKKRRWRKTTRGKTAFSANSKA